MASQHYRSVIVTEPRQHRNYITATKSQQWYGTETPLQRQHRRRATASSQQHSLHHNITTASSLQHAQRVNHDSTPT